MCVIVMGAPQREWGIAIQPLKKPTIHHPPVILKTNTVTRFKHIRISDRHLQLKDHRRLPHKHFEEGFNKIFKINKCFHRSKQKIIFSP
jgi:hypothetical protein